MSTLQIILILILVVLIIIALAIWWLIRKVKGFVNVLKDTVEGAGGLKNMGEMLASGAGNYPPCRINPVPEPNPQWRNAAEIEQITGQFLAAGFQSVGAFSIPEMAGMRIAVFAHGSERLYGVAYDHTKLPPSFDIACTYEDGTDMSVGNTTYAEAMDRPPGSLAIRLDGGTVSDALAALQQHKETSPRKVLLPESFAAHFRASYVKEMNWRMKRGGSTREEIRRQALKEGGEVTDEMVDHVYFSQRAAAMGQLQKGCIAQYLDDQGATPDGWGDISHRVFAIPDIFTPDEVREALEENICPDEDQANEIEQVKLTFGQNALDHMRLILESNISGIKLKRIGSVKEPVPADLFLDESDDDDDE